MIDLSQITLVCVDCVHYKSSIAAINKSIEKINFGKVLFFTDKIQPNTKFDQQIIPKITSKKAYSRFLMKNLVNYITTEFVLIIQWDGYVINPELWDNDFLHYDYIGAPWWYNDGYNVGNGGFSLRSKKLLLVLQEKEGKYHPEDDCICRLYRKYLEVIYDIKFADEKTAAKFSFEPNKVHNEFKNNSFGFHGIPELIKK